MSKNPKQMGSAKARNTAARLVAVQCVYDMIITTHKAEDVLADYKKHRYGQLEEGIQFVPADLELLGKIVRGVENRRDDLVEMITGAMKDRSKTTQPEALLRALLLCGVYEIIAHEELDAALIIAGYLSVCEGFFEDSETKLVHAVLDCLNKQIRA